jgi:hypothetical protein
MTTRVCEEFEAWYLCLCDPERESFLSYGLGYTSYGDIFANKGVGRGAKRAQKGGFSQHLGRTLAGASDWLQLPGAAVIDRSGTVRYMRRGKLVSDLADLGEIKALLARLSDGSSPR